MIYASVICLKPESHNPRSYTLVPPHFQNTFRYPRSLTGINRRQIDAIRENDGGQKFDKQELWSYVAQGFQCWWVIFPSGAWVF
jgi:hypothetical protein